MSPTLRSLGPAVAGTWYPADPPALASQIEGFLNQVPAPEGRTGAPLALIEPHAGYVYSGQVAAHGFRLLEGLALERVIVIGPSHYEGFHGAAIPDAECYRTPLGEVVLDGEALESLARMPGFERRNRPFGPEHSLEAEIPFLQHVLAPGWRLVPVLIGAGSSPASVRLVADGLRVLVGPRSVAVVSSDFTHYGSHFQYVPFREDVPRNIRELDMGAIQRIEARDAAGFEAYVARTDATICGRRAIDVLLHVLPPEARGTLAAYDTSGNLTGDWSHSVSYAALVFRAGHGEQPEASGFDASEQRSLLRLARASITERLRADGSLERCLRDVELTPRLREAGASFVTLRRADPAGSPGPRLRGCIGSMTAREPLYRNVVDNAARSAFEDPRFGPLRPEELDGLLIEISVLTPLRPIDGPEAIVIGRDGVELENAGRRAVFLPQVATEHGWAIEELLVQLAVKAGLPPDGWRGGKLYTFQAEHFAEE
jgi:hypothetical protein